MKPIRMENKTKSMNLHTSSYAAAAAAAETAGAVESEMVHHQ